MSQMFRGTRSVWTGLTVVELAKTSKATVMEKTGRQLPP